MIELGVNVDQVATVRQARRTYEPDPVWAAIEAHLGGADGITVHLREDRRHIQDEDVRRLRELTHALLPSMIERKFGRVISLTGTREPRNLNAAHAAKAAVHVWSKGLSKVVAKDGVTVNCLQPGKLRSEQIDKRMPTEEARRAWAKKEVPMERVGEPEELADLAVFLASPRAGYISGNVIAVDGAARFFAF